MDIQVERITSNYSSISELIVDELAKRKSEEPFYVANMQDIYQKHTRWVKLLPRIKPFYAVKCNNLPEIISFLSSLGTGFDCASKQEIDQVLSLGIEPSKIIYANPCKTSKFIEHAASVGVDVMTFDNQHELYKIAHAHPNARLVLRIKGDDRSSRIKLNKKFGADYTSWEPLLKLASELKLTVIGVSFHNGSDCEDANAYNRIIADCKQVFELAESLGHSMHLLDIGGGFPGFETSGEGLSFEKYANVINSSIDKHFPAIDPQTGKRTKIEIIAEPGRYYVASAFDFVAMVIAKRVDKDEKSGQLSYSYYLNDGVYGAFNNTFFDFKIPLPQLIEQQKFRGAKPVLNKGSKAIARTATIESIATTDYEEDFGKSYSLESDDCVSDSSGVSCSLSKSSNQKNILNLDTDSNNNNNNNNNNGLEFDNTQHALELNPTTIWGPTCDSIDCVRRDFLFPELEIGEWVSFKNMGAYTSCAASNFNGFDKASVIIAI